MFWALAVLAVSMCSPRALGSGCWTDRQPEVGVCQGFAPDFCFSEHHAGNGQFYMLALPGVPM